MKILKLWILKLRRWYENFIRLQYIKIRRGVNFVKEVHEIKVKKGKVKYYLWIVETYDGRRLRFNLGRNNVRDCDVQELELK